MDPKCISCHVTGLGERSGFKRKEPQAHLQGVSCESCHGPGSTHIEERSSGKKSLFRLRPLSESDCILCHSGEFSRPFEWVRWWPSVAHGAK